MFTDFFDGDTVEAGINTVRITASDSDDVELVRLIHNGVNLGVIKNAPYKWEIDLTEGSHRLRAVKQDGLGNVVREIIDIEAIK